MIGIHGDQVAHQTLIGSKGDDFRIGPGDRPAGRCGSDETWLRVEEGALAAPVSIGAHVDAITEGFSFVEIGGCCGGEGEGAQDGDYCGLHV
jgi:hypothetical protein